MKLMCCAHQNTVIYYMHEGVHSYVHQILTGVIRTLCIAWLWRDRNLVCCTHHMQFLECASGDFGEDILCTSDVFGLQTENIQFNN